MDVSECATVSAVYGAAAQRALDDVQVEGLAPGHRHAIDLALARLGDGGEAFGESAVDEGEDRPLTEVADRHLHESRGRRGADVHRPRGEQHVAQPRLDAGEHRLELASAMHDHRARELRENLGADFRWARNEERPEFGLSHAQSYTGSRASNGRYRRVSTRPANTLAKRPSSMVGVPFTRR